MYQHYTKTNNDITLFHLCKSTQGYFFFSHGGREVMTHDIVATWGISPTGQVILIASQLGYVIDARTAEAARAGCVDALRGHVNAGWSYNTHITLIKHFRKFGL